MTQANRAQDSREYPDRPWVGVGVVVWQDDKVLLVRRAKPPRLGEWSIPGGAQALGETIFEAAIREVREETGAAVKPTALVTVVDSMIRDGGNRTQFHYTLVEISAEWVSGDIVAGDDVDAVRWATQEEAKALVKWDETLRIIAEAARMRE